MNSRENNKQNQLVIGSEREFTTTDEIGWTASKIKHQLELRGHTLASIARENGLHESACRKALRHPWPRVERIIADYLDLSCPSELFPSRYDSEGIPIKHSHGLGNQNAKRKKGSK